MDNTSGLTIIGGGLAGSEAAWQAARLGIRVHLYEMRPLVTTGAHQTSDLAELICSNSLGSNLPDRASGILKNELRRLGSLLVECAEATALPAGSALAVDRLNFARTVTDRIQANPFIKIIREEVREIPTGPVVIASGPLTSDPLALAIANMTGEHHLYFYDAIAPIVTSNSINMDIAFRASRFGFGDKEEGDYINCPFSKSEYESFVEALTSAERIELRVLETEIEQGVRTGAHEFFEGCLPIEIIARRGIKSLAFGPMRPIGLKDPHTGKGPYAIVQLRQDNLAGSLYNLVGFQTNLTYPEQKRIFRTIPGLEKAEFIRFGQMHRNTFVAAPKIITPSLQFNGRQDVFLAGQITGVEGYMGNIATGLLAGLNAARLLQGRPLLTLPRETILGALCHYISHASMKDFQPMKANFGILPPLETGIIKIGKRDRAWLYANRAVAALDDFLAGL